MKRTCIPALALLLACLISAPVKGGDLTASGVTIKNDNVATLTLVEPTSLFSYKVGAWMDPAYQIGYLFLDQQKVDITASLRLRTRLSTSLHNLNLMVVEGGGPSAVAGVLSLYKLDSTTVEGQTRALRLNAEGNSFLNGGNVGIGIESPSAKLEVSGTVKTGDLTSTKVSATGSVNVGEVLRLTPRATAPAGTPQTGDMYFFDNGTTRQLRIYVNGSWRKIDTTVL